MDDEQEASDRVVAFGRGDNYPDTAGKRLDADCKILGIRHRRTHDARRTFISLVRADGGRRSIFKLITHGRSKNSIMDVDSEIPWDVLCGEVGKLWIERKEGAVFPTIAGGASLPHLVQVFGLPLAVVLFSSISNILARMVSSAKLSGAPGHSPGTGPHAYDRWRR